MSKNYELLHRELDFLRMHPRAHYQGEWVDDATSHLNAKRDEVVAECGTVGCLAGWTVIHELDLAPVDFMTYPPSMAFRATGVAYRGDYGDDARKMFGLNEEEARQLFAGHNTFDELEQMIKGWENEDKVL